MPEYFKGFKMNKYISIIIIFLLSFFINSFSQSWEFMYKDDFLPIAPYTGGHENLEANNIIAHNNEIAICRSEYKNVIIIYNQTSKKWRNISVDTIFKAIKGEHNFTKDDFAEILTIVYDAEGKLWGFTSNKIISIFQDTTIVFNQVYNTERNQFLNIQKIWDLKADRNGGIWAIIEHSATLPYKTFYSLCRFQDSGFVTINNIKTIVSGVYNSKMKIAFDNFGKVYHTNSDTMYILENDEVVIKIATFDFPDGYSYFSDIVINSKNVVYAMNNNMMLYIFDGENFYSDDFVLKSERQLIPQSDLSYNFMCLDSNDNVWIIGVGTCVLYKLDTNRNWTVIEVPKPETAMDEWCYKENIAVDKNGKIWIPSQKPSSSYSYGIYIYNSDTTTSTVEQPSIETPGLPDVWIRNLFPNPANLSVTLNFFLERNVSNECKIEIYNTLGMKVKDVTEQIEYNSRNMSASVVFSVSDMPTGAYIVAVIAGRSKMTRLMLVGL